MSGTIGFASFLGYLGTCRRAGTALLLPVYVTGMVRARRLVAGPLTPHSLRRHGGWFGGTDRFSAGRLLLLIGAAATAAGGLAILRVGLGDTFVPEDLDFMGVTADQLRALNPRLVPLLAHDRAGLGGAVLTMGLTTMLCLRSAVPAPVPGGGAGRGRLADRRARGAFRGWLHRPLASPVGAARRPLAAGWTRPGLSRDLDRWSGQE